MAPCSRAQLLRVWAEYLNHRRPYVKATTFSQDYRPFTNRLKAAPQWLETAEDLVTWLVETYSHDSARRTLQQVKAAFEWAAAAKVARRDPFVAIANLPQLSSPKNHWRAFEPSERAAILNLFDSQPDHYRRWTWGLFLTGCRPEELRALTVADVSKDLKQLAIARAWRIITQALANGIDVATVAYLSRNSPAVIHRHYAQRQKAPIIPEF